MTTIRATASGHAERAVDGQRRGGPGQQDQCQLAGKLNSSWPGICMGAAHSRAVLCGQRIAHQASGRLDAPRGPQRLLGAGELDDPLGQCGVGDAGRRVGATRQTQ